MGKADHYTYRRTSAIKQLGVTSACRLYCRYAILWMHSAINPDHMEPETSRWPVCNVSESKLINMVCMCLLCLFEIDTKNSHTHILLPGEHYKQLYKQFISSLTILLRHHLCIKSTRAFWLHALRKGNYLYRQENLQRATH